jgi:hypothetical protein
VEFREGGAGLFLQEPNVFVADANLGGLAAFSACIAASTD